MRVELHSKRVKMYLGIYLHAGPEIGVASTKAFTSQVRCHFTRFECTFQVLVLAMLAMRMGLQRKTIAPAYFHKLCVDLARLNYTRNECSVCLDYLTQSRRY